MGKHDGVSAMAKSLFPSVQHNPQGIVSGSKNNILVKNIQDSRKKAPFKFDVPSPDDIVFNGLHLGKSYSKAKFGNLKSSASSSSATAACDEKVMKLDRSVGSVPVKEMKNGGASPSLSKWPSDLIEIPCSKNGDEPENVAVLNNDNNKASTDTRLQPDDEWMLPVDDADDTLTQLNLAIVGHVDSGKSTLSGRLLHLLGRITQKQMQKYERDAKLQGKGSFSYAWAMDESREERERGVTMTVAVAYFDSDRYHVVLLDSPGHRDFVPNMISGATQADAAILVADASPGAFEAGLDGTNDRAGQTREHAQLVRSFGVDQIVVAVNKMDSVGYSRDRFDFIKAELGSFLRCCGFKDSSVSWIPLSAMQNQNLVAAAAIDDRLSSWYRGPCLLDAIDALQPPPRDFVKPLLMPICDVLARSSSQSHPSVCGKIEAGALRVGSKVLVMPSKLEGTIRTLERDSKPCTVARAGDSVAVGISGVDGGGLLAGGVVCHPGFPVPFARHLELKLLMLDLATPILIGSQLEFHAHHAKQAARVVKTIALLDPKTGMVLKSAPRCLLPKQSAVVEVVLQEQVCVQEYCHCRALGRVSLRALGRTIALGVINRIIYDSHI